MSNRPTAATRWRIHFVHKRCLHANNLHADGKQLKRCWHAHKTHRRYITQLNSKLYARCIVWEFPNTKPHECIVYSHTHTLSRRMVGKFIAMIRTSNVERRTSSWTTFWRTFSIAFRATRNTVRILTDNTCTRFSRLPAGPTLAGQDNGRPNNYTHRHTPNTVRYWGWCCWWWCTAPLTHVVEINTFISTNFKPSRTCGILRRHPPAWERERVRVRWCS